MARKRQVSARTGACMRQSSTLALSRIVPRLLSEGVFRRLSVVVVAGGRRLSAAPRCKSCNLEGNAERHLNLPRAPDRFIHESQSAQARAGVQGFGWVLLQGATQSQA